MNHWDELFTLTKGVKDFLEYMSDLGVESVPDVKVEPVRLTPPASKDASGPRLDESPAQGTASQPRKSPADKIEEPRRRAETLSESLEDVRADLGDCTRCPLHRERTGIVFGKGSPTARIMFVGGGPGREEDLEGRPFLGESGQLLTDIIVKGMKRRLEECYFTNIVKCRPSQNREPAGGEAKTCLQFLNRQIAAINPKVIVALGPFAAQYLLDSPLSLDRLRNRFHRLRGVPVMPTHHPAALLREPSRKRETWEDIKLVVALLDES